MNKDFGEDIGYILVLLIMAIVLIAIFNKKGFEYYINGKLGKSNDCYQTKDGYCYCNIEDEYVLVDNYYVAE